MKLIVIITLFVVAGVASEQPEVTSADTALKDEKLSTSLKTKLDERPASRRDGISYSTSVVHRDPNHPEQDAASSIDFRLNTDHNSASYTTPKYDFGANFHSHLNDQRQPEENHHVHGQEHEDVIYGKNAGLATTSFQFKQEHQGFQPVPHKGHDSSQQGTQSSHSHHHPFHKQPYVQPMSTETKHKIDAQHLTTQFKHGSNGGRVLNTPRPKTTSLYRQGAIRSSHPGHGSHSSYSSHNYGSHSHLAVHKLPAPQAYTQAMYQSAGDSGKSGKSISLSHHGQNHAQNDASGQTQSFNVGYSVKFGNDGHQGLKRKPFKVHRPDSDIITGSHKEDVNKPLHLSHFAHHRFSDSGHDDPKQYSASSNSPQHVLSQAHLTPKTQKQLAFLENIQSHKFVQKEPRSNFPWRNLSPSVEIYKSKEISLPGSAVTKNYAFDHEKAIGKSEGFDYTNAIDLNGNIIKVLPSQGSHSSVQHKSYLPISGLNQATGAQGTESQQVQVQAQLKLQPQSESAGSFVRITDSRLGSKSSQMERVPALSKLPIDTSLIREPYLTMHKDRAHPHGAQLPIHFDTSLIKDVGQAYGQIFNDEPSINSAAVSESGSASTYHENLAQISHLLAEQSQQHNSYQQLMSGAVGTQQLESVAHNEQQYPQQVNNPILLLQPAQTSQIGQNVPNSQSSLDDMTFNFPQNGLFNPVLAMVSKPQDSTSMPVLFTPQGQVKAIDPQLLKHLKMYKVKEHVSDHAQPQLKKFKVFGKPANGYMRHQQEKMRHGMPPRAQAMQSGNKRQVKDYTNIEMDLRPPPIAIPFKTSNFLRN